MFNPFKFIENNKVSQEARKNKEGLVSREQQPPIRASLIDRNDIDPYTDAIIRLIEKDGLDIDYRASENFYKKNKILNHGSETYAISTCDDRDKFSKGYYNCTGLVVVGTDKESGKQVSFMSHQDPKQFLGYTTIKASFKEDLEKVLTELDNIADKGTVDVLIYGGQYPKDRSSKYEEQVKFISEIIKSRLNINPTVLTGPNVSFRNEEADVYFNTQHRRLYVVRPFQDNNSANESYLVDDYKKQEEKWLDQ